MATNIIEYQGRQIPARIDDKARIATIIATMASNFGGDIQPITLCLRDASDRLVTKATLPAKVKSGEKLRLSPSPAIEALNVTTSLRRELRSITSPAAATFWAEDQGEEGEEDSSNKLPLKLAMFNIQKYVKEQEFAVDFMLKRGVRMLVALMESDGMAPNTLAGIRGLLEYEAAWQDMSLPFIDRLVYWITTSTAPNILRPATAIMRKIFMSSMTVTSSHTKLPALPDRNSNTNPEKQTVNRRQTDERKYGSGEETVAQDGRSEGPILGPGKALNAATVAHNHQTGGVENSKPTAVPTTSALGYGALWDRIADIGDRFQSLEPQTSDAGTSGSDLGSVKVWKIVVKRLEGTGDLELVAQSLGLINATLKAGQEAGGSKYDELVALIEHLAVRKLVARLIPITTTEPLERAIYAFQSRYAGILQHRRLVPVDPSRRSEHERMLGEIWAAADLANDRSRTSRSPRTEMYDVHAKRDFRGWIRIGLLRDEDAEETRAFGEGEMFRDVGELGLECLHWTVLHDEDIINTLAEQAAKPKDRQCPLGLANVECVKTVCEHYKLSSAALRPPTHFQTFLLHFPRLVKLVLDFFLRMWRESEATTADFHRISHLVKSQLAVSLANESSKTWLTLEQDLLEGDYRAIRERQMDWIEREDGIMSSAAVTILRETVKEDATEVIRNQRMSCLLRGAWFNAAVPVDKEVFVKNEANPAKPMRFVRLTPNGKSLMWGEYTHRTELPPPIDVLPKKIDVLSIGSIQTSAAHAVNSRSQGQPSRLSLSILSRSGESILDLDAIHGAQKAEWVDGLGMLLGKEQLGTVESEEYVKILTELGIKIRLLDIGGDGIEIPDKLDFARAPLDDDFWFADQ